MKNPLLENTPLPLFSQIRPEHIEPAVNQVLEENRGRIAALVTSLTTTTENSISWESLVLPLEVLDNRLQKVWSPINHLHSVLSSEELRKAYHHCIPKITTYQIDLEQNKELYQAFKDLAKSKQFSQLSFAQQKVIKNYLLAFHLSGVSLPDANKQRFREIQKRLAELSTKFEENVLDATQNWFKHVENAEGVIGIPEHILNTAKELAQSKNLSGWVFTLDFPSYHPVLSYAKNRELRKEMYQAYSTRASDQGPDAGKFDNSALMFEILKLRHELSLLLGFNNYAELSLATKMVKNPIRVLKFIEELILHAHPKGKEELEELSKFANKVDGITELHPWDIAFYSERLSQQEFGINDTLLRPYFPEAKVLQGLFQLTEQLYGMRIIKEKNLEVWHTDVSFYSIYDQDNILRGQFYLDLYARPQKKGGAWMDECHQRWLYDGQLQIPVAYLTCNLTPPSGEDLSLLTHDEVLTIFHEYGHGIHHLLTKIDYLNVSGIRGVEWDAVELPSQLMEFFSWEKAVLHLISEHYETGEPLPHDLLVKLRKAKNFHTGLKTLRQLEFTLFDFNIHLNFSPNLDREQIQNTIDTIRSQIAVLKVPTWNRFSHSFTHIFSGGYAAGYYSYLWAEMLATDAFAKFVESGVIDLKVGKEFLTIILEMGGSVNALELFTRFRGREPTIKPLLDYLGL